MPLVFYTSSVVLLGISSCWGRLLFFWGGRLSAWSFLWLSIRVSLLLESIYSFRKPVCRGWKWIFQTRTHVCHHGLAFSNFELFWVLLSRSIFVIGPSSCPCNSFPMLLIHSAFLLYYPRFYILPLNYFVFLSSGCQYIFEHSLSTCW